MPSRLFYTLSFIVLMQVLVALPGCRSRAESPAEPAFVCRDEASMRKMLTGTWILRAYEDSIDAGLTPKLLTYMLDGRSYLMYGPDGFRSAVYHERHSKVEQNLSQPVEYHQNSLLFDPAHQRILVRVMAYATRDSFDTSGIPHSITDAHSRLVRVDTAELLLSDGDTVLRWHSDSTAQDFIRYDRGQCTNDVYSHLVNSKFIAGKYYALDDTAHAHHIIFTRCGNIEGEEYIEPSLRGRTDYRIDIADFSDGPDEMLLYDPRYKLGLPYYWEVSGDSLILSTTYINAPNTRIVLVKAL